MIRWLSSLVLFLATVKADVVLNEKIMKLAKTSAELSALAYEEDPPGDGFQDFGFYDEEPDQALMAKKDGYCFGAFRGTTMTWIDWQQNIRFGKEDVCSEKTCCQTRTGFYDAYDTDYKKAFESSIRKCAATCDNPDECVVLTGHSQGGAIAAVAALFLADLNPYVMTFGQPHTIESPCELVSSQRWFRFINTKDSGKVGLTYDPVSFVPGLGADSFGHMLLLSTDSSGVAYIGLDAQDAFGPLNVGGFEAHSMKGTPTHPGYLDRLEHILGNVTTYPIRTTGYADGSLCTESKECESGKCASETRFTFNRCVGVECEENKDCETDRCDHGLCIPKLGSCMPCDEDSDCAGNKCLLFKCAGSDGLMDDNCVCKWDSDCSSGRCEGLVPPQCEAQRPLGTYCDENSDCLSGYCNWKFHCADRLPGGSFCNQHEECQSGHCSWWFRCSAVSSSSSVALLGGSANVMAEEAEKKNEAVAEKEEEKFTSTADEEPEANGGGHVLGPVLGGLIVVVVGFLGGKNIMNRKKTGYTELSSHTMDV